MKTAVIYTRSTEENDAAIQSQIILCKTFALKNDFKILHIYSDFKKSGIGNKLPALCKLLKDIKSCRMGFATYNRSVAFNRRSAGIF